MQCSYIPANDRGEGKGGGGERRRGRREEERVEVRLGGEREEKEEGELPMGGVSGTQERRRNEGDDMKWEIRGWEGTTLRGEKNEGQKKRGVKRGGGIKEKSVGAVHTENMTRGGRGGMGEGTVYLSSVYFGNMDSVQQAASFKVEPET